eukprot:CAMPEP_0173224326 /NCGR_PEP_ID=MMETSP1142-20121109/4279_1 /TAXON_ID=483371 /ORGANISM="non described non described, Strain CCMP2298" /LENGTH=178 /DNA_ID=CAMNT_0014152585 /DNA_START=89 /DNA_END=623 /DNA_ORIENTATION=-
MMLGRTKEEVETILNLVWAQFGSPASIFYDPAGSYCFLSFSSHEEAEIVKNGLNDQVRFIRAAVEVLQASTDELLPLVRSQSRRTTSQKTRAFSSLIHLLGINPAVSEGEVILRATWAPLNLALANRPDQTGTAMRMLTETNGTINAMAEINCPAPAESASDQSSDAGASMEAEGKRY